MSKHYIHDSETGKPLRDANGNKVYWSDSDGDWSPENHQTVYRETPDGNREVKDVHYDPEHGKFHSK